MTLQADNARRILRRAFDSNTGIIVDVEPTGEMMAPTWRAKQILYRFKQEDADFKRLQIEFDPDTPDTALWILKTGGHDAQDQ